MMIRVTIIVLLILFETKQTSVSIEGEIIQKLQPSHQLCHYIEIQQLFILILISKS